MKRRKLYPLPVEELFSHPAWIAMPPAARGMLMSVIEHYWRTECRPLPTGDALFCVARANRASWARHRDEIVTAFEAVRPGLDGYFRLREAKGTTLSFASHKGGAKKRLQALQTQSSLASTPTYAIATLPVREPPQTERPAPPTERPARKRLTDTRVA